MGIISKKKKQTNKNKTNFAHAAHFFANFFAVVLQDYNEKLPKTS